MIFKIYMRCSTNFMNKTSQISESRISIDHFYIKYYSTAFPLIFDVDNHLKNGEVTIHKILEFEITPNVYILKLSWTQNKC